VAKFKYWEQKQTKIALMNELREDYILGMFVTIQFSIICLPVLYMELFA